MIVLLLVGCASKQQRADTLLGAGYAAAACSIRNRDALQARRVLEKLDLQLALEVAPVEAFGVKPRGYGEDHHLVAIGMRRRAGMMTSLDIDLQIDGWTVCAECGVEWMLERMQVPGPPEPEPGAKKEGVGFLGAMFNLGSGLFEATRAVFGLVLLVPDMVFSVLLWGGGYRMEMTKFLLNPGSSATPLSSGAMIGPLVPVRSSDALRSTTDGPSMTRMVFTGSGVPETLDVTVTWPTPCPGQGTAHFQLAGDDFVEALASAVPPQGRSIPLKWVEP